MGGSGGGGRSLDRSQLDALEQAARRALKEADQPIKRKVFISFANEDLSEVNLLRAQAKNEGNNLEFSDHSLHEPFNSENADYIKKGIRERINRSSVTICYISESTANSSWVDWEIRESIRLGKGVIAVHKGEKLPTNLPKAIRDHSIKVIQWNHKDISAEVERAARGRSGSE